jgi:tetratricopeptide (TPR) repeat protein
MIDEHVALLRARHPRCVVLEVVGLGGAGKSRFLDETRARLGARPDPPTLVSVSLDDERSTTAIGPLLAIRNQLTIDCFFFDTALLTYWAAMDQPRQPIGKDGANSSAARTLLGGSEIGHDRPAPGFGIRVFAGIPVDDALRLGYGPDEFRQIDALRDRPNDLYARLPDYLGTDIARRQRNPDERRLVIFYDGYDKQSDHTRTKRAPWLRRLITTMHAGVHIIAARKRLGWKESELRHCVDTIFLGALPDPECRRMIRRALGDLERNVEDKLVDVSGSFPFHLRAVIDVCRAEIHRNGAVRIDDLPTTHDDVVERFLDHLSRPQHTLAVMLAALQYFDEPLYGHLIHSAGLPADVIAMNEFVQWFFVEAMDDGLFKTHDLLTDAVRRSARVDPRITRTLRSAATHLDVQTKEPPPVGADRFPQLFHALVEAWQSTEVMPADDVVQLIDIGYHLYDAGQWQGMRQLPGVTSDVAPHPARVIAQYFAALATRRTDGPREGLRRLEPLVPVRPLLGRHATSFDVELAYLREISGDYAYAREEFRRLNTEADPFDPGRRDHLRARLYHADMLIMDGHFAEANELLADTYEHLDPRRSIIDRAELMRHRGHGYRFSLEFRAAEERYVTALEASEDSPSMRGKLRTNLAEARCWHDPRLALKSAAVAIDVNTRLGSRIEVAKVQAARGVALARLGKFAEARNACEAALEISAEINYPAAGCFARQALVVLEVWSGNPSRADEAYEDLLASIDSLGTYTHLAVIPAWIRGDDVEFRRCSRHVGWISGTSPTSGLELIGRG